ncbi:hypothetical protein P5V15_000020 [Pogonomyrmex californicus]
MPRCIANGCENTTDIKKKPAAQVELEKIMRITFHSFPSDPIRRAEWIRILQLENKIIGRSSRLCCLHFKEEYIDRSSLVYVRLKENAVPHVFENMYDDIKIGITDLKCDKETNTSLSLLPKKLNTRDKETRISPERICNMNSSNMEMIGKATSAEIKHLRQRIQTLKRQIWRKEKKIETMRIIVEKFKIETVIRG